MVILQPALYYRGKRRVQFTLQILSVGGGEVVLNIIPRQIVVNHGIGVGDGLVVQKRRNNRDRGGRDAVRGGCSVRAAVADYPVRRRGCGGRAAVQKIMEE